MRCWPALAILPANIDVKLPGDGFASSDRRFSTTPWVMGDARIHCAVFFLNFGIALTNFGDTYLQVRLRI